MNDLVVLLEGMTWGQFKALVEARGAKDDDVLWYIDVTAPVDEFINVEHTNTSLKIND